jgi:hypothetical protein
MQIDESAVGVQWWRLRPVSSNWRKAQTVDALALGVWRNLAGRGTTTISSGRGQVEEQGWIRRLRDEKVSVPTRMRCSLLKTMQVHSDPW